CLGDGTAHLANRLLALLQVALHLLLRLLERARRQRDQRLIARRQRLGGEAAESVAEILLRALEEGVAVVDGFEPCFSGGLFRGGGRGRLGYFARGGLTGHNPGKPRAGQEREEEFEYQGHAGMIVRPA